MISTTTNSTNSMTSVQLTGMNWRRQALDQAERNAARERAGGIAEAAQGGHDEALELIGVAGEHGEWEHGRDQHAGDAGERHAEPEGERQHARRRNAGQLGGLAVVGDCADRLAHSRVVEKQIQRSGDHTR